MPLRKLLAAIALTLAATGALAQTAVRTEAIRRPGAPIPANSFQPDGPAAEQSRPADNSKIIRDAAMLPPAVARTRDLILAAARSGDLQKLVAVMQMNKTMPVFTLSNEQSPIMHWKATFPESDGIEVLSILVTILETGFVHVDQGTPQDTFVWPYFARVPIKALTAEQKVELFRIMTGADYKTMADTGGYAFFRLGIAPDGTWRFFVAGN